MARLAGLHGLAAAAKSCPWRHHELAALELPVCQIDGVEGLGSACQLAHVCQGAGATGGGSHVAHSCMSTRPLAILQIGGDGLGDGIIS